MHIRILKFTGVNWLLARITMAVTSLLLLIAVGSVSAAEQYLCVAEKSVGFSYNKSSKEWENTNFKSNSKYVISKSNNDKYAFKVIKVGDKYPDYSCKSDFNEPGFLFCSGIMGEFKFNRKNGRYLLFYSTGYFNVLPEVNKITDEKSDTPYIERGVFTSLHLVLYFLYGREDIHPPRWWN